MCTPRIANKLRTYPDGLGIEMVKFVNTVLTTPTLMDVEVWVLLLALVLQAAACVLLRRNAWILLGPCCSAARWMTSGKMSGPWCL